MYKNLRIIFTILSAICVTAVLPVGAFLNFTWAIITALIAFLLYLLMMACKQAQEKQDTANEKNTPNPMTQQENAPEATISTNNDNTER